MNKLSASQQAQIADCVDSCFDIAEHHFNRTFTRPAVMFTQRGQCAGSARLHTNQIRLNATLLIENWDTFILQVIPHEVCHLLTFQLYGRVKPHGVEWRNLMKTLFKLPPLTKHTMDVSNVVGKTYAYTCACQQHQLTIRRHNKVVKGMEYQCRKCGELLIRSEE